MLGITTTNARVGGFRGGISAEAKTIYNRIIADGGVSNLTRLNFFVKGLKAIYGDLANVPVCYDAHWIGYKLGSGTGATSGQAAAKLYSLTVAGDAVQSTAASQPLLLAHNGASSDNYLYAGPGSDVAGAYCQTSTNVSPQVNTNFTFEFNFKDFNSRGILGGCPTGSSDGWSLQIQGGTNLLRLYVRILSVNTAIDSTTAITVTGNRWVKVVRSGNDYSFFEKADGGTYTQVGTTITNSVVLNSYNLPIQIGSGFGINYASIGCKILRARFYNDATATNLVVDFNPATYNASTSQTQWTSSTGEVWTISTGTATTGYKGVLVNRTIVQSDGVDDNFVSNNIDQTTTNKMQVINVGKKFTNTANSYGYSVIYEKTLNLNSVNGAVFMDFNEGTSSVSGLKGNVGLSTFANFSETSLLLQMFSSNFDMSLSTNEVSRYLNNVLETGTRLANADNTGNFSNDKFYLFSRAGTTGFSNYILNTFITINNTPDTIQMTATYNLIRSLNENAF